MPPALLPLPLAPCPISLPVPSLPLPRLLLSLLLPMRACASCVETSGEERVDDAQSGEGALMGCLRAEIRTGAKRIESALCTRALTHSAPRPTTVALDRMAQGCSRLHGEVCADRGERNSTGARSQHPALAEHGEKPSSPALLPAAASAVTAREPTSRLSTDHTMSAAMDEL